MGRAKPAVASPTPECLAWRALEAHGGEKINIAEGDRSTNSVTWRYLRLKEISG
jgi:hypothetical protein